MGRRLLQPGGPGFSVSRFFTAVLSTLGCGVVTVLALGLVTGAGGWSNPRPLSSLSVQDPRLVVLKSKRVLYLFDHDRLVRTYPVDLGFAAAGQKFRAGDGRTPEGNFRIVTKNASSPYHRFLGINYPGEESIKWGLQQGLISGGQAISLLQAIAADQRPDWDTPLGGGIGIHGHREGMDWTAGCIALSDQHVEELFEVLRIGDPVEILP
ncbi:MAG: L,D-transpeptidase [Phycisphaerales bacterium]|nr:MAG: L,D-transpeptidase [Phycisphaerales bacterium]